MLLDWASQAARRDATPVGNSQFIYTEVKSRTTFVSTDADGRTTRRTDDGAGRYWASVDGSKPGWAESIDKLRHPYGLATPADPNPTLGNPTYKYLTTLPTDPDKLLAKIRAAVRATAGSKPHAIDDADQAAFSIIGDLIRRGFLPPKLGAALYQAAARIPGVKIVQNDVDAAGRHGVGVARGGGRGRTRVRRVEGRFVGVPAWAGGCPSPARRGRHDRAVRIRGHQDGEGADQAVDDLRRSGG